VQLLGEIDAMIQDLPERLRTATSSTKTVRAKVAVLQSLDEASDSGADPVVQLRAALLRQRIAMLEDVLEQDRVAATELKGLVEATGSSLCSLVGISTRAAAEILVEVGDIRRFTEGGFARYTGTAPIPASSGEGAGEPTGIASPEVAIDG
jgi:transposase